MTSDPVVVRHVSASDAEAWLTLRDALWPGSLEDHVVEIGAFLAEPPEREACFIAERSGEAVGFAETRLRVYAEGCSSSPVGYLEGIYVRPDERGIGVARALNAAGEAWARSMGCSEMGSDRETTNEVSARFHEGVGYEEVGRIVCYRKVLGGGERG